MAIEWTLIVQVILTIGLWTIVFKDNALYMVCEYVSLGLVPAYLFVTTLNDLREKTITQAFMKGDLWAGLGLFLGALVMLRLSRKYSWVARPSMAIIVGNALGMAMRGYLKSQFGDQIAAAARSLIAPTPYEMINGVLMLVMTVGSVAYFVFTRNQRGRWGYITKIGRISMMAAWGTMYATTTTGRINYVIGRLQFIFYDFLGIKV